MNARSIPAIAIFGLWLLLLPSVAHSRTWYVQQDGSGDAPTIQAAVDSSWAGDSILVAPGTYTQTWVLITDKDSLTIRSEQGALQTVLQPRYPNILWIGRSTHIAVEGFTFENSGSTALGLSYSQHVYLEGNIVRHAGECAILLEMSSDVTIRGNLICSNHSGIYCRELSSSLYIRQNTISHNMGGSGISFDDVNFHIENNVITYNKVGVDGTDAYFSCNDVYGNGTNYILLFMGDPTGTNGNISVPPLYCGVDPPSSGNYYLREDSPCAPGNHPEGYMCGLIGRYDAGCGNTGTDKTTWGRIKTMYTR